MSDALVDFLRARLDEDEAAARGVPELGHNFDMGGNRQDEVFYYGRLLPSSADGRGNWSKHEHSPTTKAHFSRWKPGRVLAEVEAKRRIIDWAIGFMEGDYAPWNETCLELLALPYADHPDFRQEWAREWAQ